MEGKRREISKRDVWWSQKEFEGLRIRRRSWAWAQLWGLGEWWSWWQSQEPTQPVSLSVFAFPKSLFADCLWPLVAAHSSTLAWKIPWTEEPGGLQPMGLLRARHNFTFTFTFPFTHWRRKWQPTPVFLPGESQGRWEPGGLPSMGSHRVGHD